MKERDEVKIKSQILDYIKKSVKFEGSIEEKSERLYAMCNELYNLFIKIKFPDINSNLE